MAVGMYMYAVFSDHGAEHRAHWALDSFRANRLGYRVPVSWLFVVLLLIAWNSSLLC